MIFHSFIISPLFQLNINDHNLPEEMPEAPFSDEFLKSLHHAIMEVIFHIIH